jgi:NAD(P)-dependent dehydrogenase (short-subunit alcohol dehydrogenase family)
VSAAPSLADRVAIVTGASGGIGRAACLALARAGARVAAVGRDRDRVAATAAAIRECGAAAFPVPDVDVRFPERVDAMVAMVLDRFGRVDVLVAAAGVGPMGAGEAKVPCGVSRLSVGTWDEVIGTNLGGTFLVNRAVIPPMIAAGGGDIVNVASARGSTSGRAYASAYCASKFGVVGMSQALADEVRPHGIRVQVLLPDAVDTPLVRGSTLTRGGALPADMVGDFLVDMLGRARDAVLLEPVVAPFGAAS